MRLFVVSLALTAAVSTAFSAAPSTAPSAAPSAAAVEGRPLPSEQCRALAKDFAKAIGREPVLRVADLASAKLPYADPLPKGQACVFTAEAGGRRAAARAGTALYKLKFKLYPRDWEDAPDLSTDGGEDSQIGLRKGAARLVYAIEDHPAPSCRDLGPEDRCRAPDGAHAWVFRAAAYEQQAPASTAGRAGATEPQTP